MINDQSQIYQKTKGSYIFEKMAGRSKENFMKYQPNPHENRFILKESNFKVK